MKQEEKYYLFVSAKKYTYITQEADLDDKWDRDNTSSSWEFNKIYFGKSHIDQKGYNDLYIQISKEDYENKNLHAVIAVWSTGDSFGHDDGYNAEIISVHQDINEAEIAKQMIENSAKRDHNKKLKLGNEYELNYLPWNGYFESLDYVVII